MGTPLIIQNSATNVVVYIESSSGLPATGLTHEDITVGIKKEGASFVVFPVDATSFTEVSDGFYVVDLAASDTDTLGSLYLSFAGANIKNTLLVAHVATPTSAPPQPPAGFTPIITTIFGYMYDAQGAPKPNAAVMARVVGQPTLIHPDDQGIVLSADLIRVVTDSSGFFSLNLVAGASVEITIPSANYRRTILVPSTTTNLFEMP